MTGISPSLIVLTRVADALIISLNELRSLLRKAFEGTYAHQFDVEAMAEQIISLQAYGLDGVSRAIEIASDAQIPQAPPQNEPLSKTHCRIDGKGASLLTLNDAITDLALAMLSVHSTARLDIRAITDPDLIMASLSRLASEDLFALAIWRQNQNHFAAFSTPDDKSLRIGPTQIHKAGTIIYLIAASTQDECLDAASRITDLSPDDWQTFMSHPYQLEHFIDHGFEVSSTHYRALNGMAARLLVETSEQSRKGAGD